MKSLGIYKVDFTDVSKYYSAGIWSMDKNILRFMLKNIWHIWQSVLVPYQFATSHFGHPHLSPAFAN